MKANILCFCLTAIMAISVGVWFYTVSGMVPGLSDSPQYGIPHGSPAQEWIRNLVTRHTYVTTLPLVAVAFLALAGWAHAIYFGMAQQTHRPR